jgi:hypothetical protein
MKDLNTRAWLALAVLAVVMGLQLFVSPGAVQYCQAWVYLSIFTGASVLTTLYLMRKDPALLEPRMSGGSMAEQQPVQKFIMLCTSTGFIALPFVWWSRRSQDEYQAISNGMDTDGNNPLDACPT